MAATFLRKTAVATALAAATLAAPALTLGEGQTFTYTASGTIDLSDGLLSMEGGALILAASDSLDLGVLTLLSSGSITGNAVPSVLNLNDQTMLGGGLFPLIGGLPSGPASLQTVNHGHVLQVDLGQLQLQWQSSFVNAAGANFEIGNDLGIVHGDDQGLSLSHRFTNQAGATLLKSRGAGVSVIDVELDNSGLVAAATGTLQLAAGGNHDGGRFQGVGGTVELRNVHQLSGDVVFDGGIRLAADGLLAMAPGASLTVSDVSASGAAFEVLAGGQLLQGGLLRIESGGTLRNAGTLQASASGVETQVLGQLDNTGLLDHGAANSLLSVAGGLNNGSGGTLIVGNAGTPESTALLHAGRIVNDGSLTLNGPSFSLAGSLLSNNGQLQNNGTWSLAGSFTGGGTGVLVNAGTLVVQPGGRIQLDAGGRIDNPGGMLIYGGPVNIATGASLSNGGSIQMFGGATLALDGTLDLALYSGLYMNPGSSVTGQGTVLTAGLITIGSGAAVDLQSITQTDGELHIDGQLNARDIIQVGGVISGSGTINGGPVHQLRTLRQGVAGAGLVVGGGEGTAVLRPGQLSVGGAVVIAANGELDLQVQRQADGSLSWSQLFVDSISLLDGSRVHIAVGNGVSNDSLQTLSFLSCTAGCSFADSVSFVVDGAPRAMLSFGSDGIALALPPVQAVPEPGTAVLGLAGLLVVGRRARRRRALALAAAGLSVQPAVRAAISFDLTDLSQYAQSGTVAIATGINSAGSIVGNRVDGNGVQSDAWLLAAGSQSWVELGQGNSNYLPVRAVAINDNNTVLGNTLHNETGGPGRPVTWAVSGGQPGAAKALAPNNALVDSLQAVAFNNSGLVLLADPSSNAYLSYTYDGQTVNKVSGEGFTYRPHYLALGRNGELGGSMLYGDHPDYVRHANLGGYGGIDLSPDIGQYPNPNASELTGLNGNGQAVGMKYVGAYGSQPTPFLWSAAAGMVDLNSMLNADGVFVPFMAQVTAINDSGQIVGQTTSGLAALLTPTGSMNYVVGAGVWDTPFGLLPSQMLDFVVAPAGSYVFIDDIGLSGAIVKSLTLGTLQGGGAPGSPTYEMQLSLNLVSSSTLTIGSDAAVTLNDGSSIATSQGLVNRGRLIVGQASLSGGLSNDGGALSFGGQTVLQGDLQNLHGGDLWVSGALAVSGGISNQSFITIAAGAQVGSTAFTQDGGGLTVDGTLDTGGGPVTLNGGFLRGSGTINAEPVQPLRGLAAAGAEGGVLIGTGALLQPGHLTIVGKLTIDAGGTVEFDVTRLADGSLDWGRLAATSISFLDGSAVHFVIGDGVAGDAVQTLSFLACAEGCSFAGQVSYVVDGAPGATIVFGSDGLQLVLPPVQAVPEPASAVLMLAGLWALRRLRRA